MSNFDPTRAREPRADAVSSIRRERRAGTIDRMQEMKLDNILPSQIDRDNYEWRWVNEADVQRMYAIDYDFVNPATDIKGYKPDAETGAESTDRLSRGTGVGPDGKAGRAFLMRKYKDWFTEEYEMRTKRRLEALGQAAKGNVTGLNAGEFAPASNDGLFAGENNKTLAPNSKTRRGTIS